MTREGAGNTRLVAIGLGLLVINGLLAPTGVDAMGISSCDDPFLFPGAAVNAVVLPFRVSDPHGDGELSDTGRSLATLIQLEVLMSLIKYQSVGAVVLRENGRDGCDAVEVLESLKEQIVPGHGLILIWGRLFEQQDQVYVQTYVRFLRGERREELTFTLTGKGESRFEFQAPLPSTSLTFAPRRLGRDDIEQIDNEFRYATMVRSSPDLETSGEILHQDPDQPFAYSITDVRDGWLEVAERGGAQRGWIRAREEGDWPLRRKLPELALIDAIAGYLRLQSGGDNGILIAPRSTTASIQGAIKTYREYAGNGETMMAEATASALLGLVALNSEPKLESSIQEVSEQFALAAQQAPYDSVARNLAAMPPILRYGNLEANPEFAKQAVSRLLGALALDPENTQALANLEAYYGYLRQRQTDSPAYSPEELDQRWQLVKSIRENTE